MSRVVIIGGGASGMTAAITAAESHDVMLLERQSRVGRKLLSTGNGRCNLTHLGAGESSYHGAPAEFIRPALAAFGPEAARDWFRSLGLLTVAEPDGRVYPYSDQAGSVLDVLRYALRRENIEIRTACPATGLIRREDGFQVETESGAIDAEGVIVACGGAAGGKLGGVTDGYRLLESLGHRTTKLYPALVQLKTGTGYPKALKGVKAQAALTLLRGGEALARTRGEVLFTEYGVSGPAVFDLSRWAVTAGEGTVLALDLLPDLTEEALWDLLTARRRMSPDLPGEELLAGGLQSRLGRMVYKYAGGKAGTPMAELPDRLLRSAAAACRRFELPVTGDLGLMNAQVTAGGVDTRDFDPRTLGSRLCPGLYACGEVLDVDGDCGGYNLQWAWASGRLAGRLL